MVSCSSPADKEADKKEVAASAESASAEKAEAVAAPAPVAAQKVPDAPKAAPKPPAAKPAGKAPAAPPTPVTALPPPQLPPAPPEPAAPQVVTAAPVELPPPPPAPPAPVIRKVTIPSGTVINIRMIDSINSDSDHVGQSFHASLSSPVLIDNQVVVPKDADVYVKLVEVRAAGNMTGTSQVKVQLDRIFVGNTAYPVTSNIYLQAAASQTQKTAKTVGIGGAIGAAIGAIAGGKKGAAIGAGVGAGSGAAVEAATKGEQVRIASEAALVFRLETPVEVTLSADEIQPAPDQSVITGKSIVEMKGPARTGVRRGDWAVKGEKVWKAKDHPWGDRRA